MWSYLHVFFSCSFDFITWCELVLDCLHFVMWAIYTVFPTMYLNSRCLCLRLVKCVCFVLFIVFEGSLDFEPSEFVSGPFFWKHEAYANTY